MKTAAIWSLDLRRTGAAPKYGILADHIARAIAEGQLKPGDRIPSVAELARTLKVNPATVVRAFRELERKKLIASQVGRGSFVAVPSRNGKKAAADATPPGPSFASDGGARPETARPEVARLVRRLRDAHVSAMNQLLALTGERKALNFWAGVPPDTSVSPKLVERLTSEAFRRDPARLFRYSHYGLPELRETLAAWLTSRGYRLAPEQVLITNGSQQALALAALLAREDGRAMLCETPTYIGIPRLFSQTGHLVESVPWEGRELRPDRLQALARSRRSLIYCCPEFQNPSGQCMSEEGRATLATLAVESDAVVVVDDIFRDLRFAGDERPSLYQQLPPARRILAGSISKSFLPGLRVGFLAADRPLIDELSALKRWMDLGGPPLVQAIAHQLIAGGHYAEHLARMRGYYRERRDAMCSTLEKTMPEGVTFTRPEGGFQLWVQMPPGFSSVAVYLQALERGIAIYPGSAHDIDGRYLNCFRMAYGWASPEEIRRGVAVLADVVRRVLASGAQEPSATGIL